MKRNGLMVGLVILALAGCGLWLRAPHYKGLDDSVSGAREATLKQDLAVMREAIHSYTGDKGHPPESLQELVNAGYMRGIPLDPLTQTSDWIIIAAQKSRGIADVHSASVRVGRNGTKYNSW